MQGRASGSGAALAGVTRQRDLRLSLYGVRQFSRLSRSQSRRGESAKPDYIVAVRTSGAKTPRLPRPGLRRGRRVSLFRAVGARAARYGCTVTTLRSGFEVFRWRVRYPSDSFRRPGLARLAPVMTVSDPRNYENCRTSSRCRNYFKIL